VSAVEVRRNGEAGLCFGGADEAQDLLIAVERFAGPVLGDLGKQAVFDGIPFGSAGGIVGHRECQAMRVSQLPLKFGFPSATTTAITADSVAQNEKLPGSRI